MPVQSAPFAPTVITGDDAKSFTRRLQFSRGTKAVAVSAENGRALVAIFRASGSVTIALKQKKRK